MSVPRDALLVSIVMPTRNRPELLEKAIESALAQTHESIELLVCDDASDSDIGVLVRGFEDERIRFLRSDVPTFKAGVFIEGLRASAGEYVMEMNDDDLMAPHCVEQLLTPLQRDPTLVASFSDFWVIDGDGTIDEEASRAATRTWTRDRLREGRQEPFIEEALGRQAMWTSICGLLRRRALDLDDFPVDVETATDYWLAYLACREGGAAWYSPERLGFYREHGGNATGNVTHRRLAARQGVYERMLRDIRVSEVHGELRRRLCEAMTSEAALFLREGQRREARVLANQTAMRCGQSRKLIAVGALSYLPLGPAAARRSQRPWKYRSYP